MLTNLDALDASIEEQADETGNPILQFRRSDQDESAEKMDFSPTRSQRLYLPIRRLLDFTLALLMTLIAIPIAREDRPLVAP